jgi:Family of unknown function (DUF6644)
MHFLEWLSTSALANAMNGPEWAFPVVETFHFIGFALLIGTIAIVDLRLLGLGLRREPVSQLAGDLAPWTLAGLVLMLTTGPAMFSADAVVYYFNPSFRLKMMCLLVAIVYNFTIHRMVTQSDVSPIAGKLAACLSLLLWTGVVAGGRMIAFT